MTELPYNSESSGRAKIAGLTEFPSPAKVLAINDLPILTEWQIRQQSLKIQEVLVNKWLKLSDEVSESTLPEVLLFKTVELAMT